MNNNNNYFNSLHNFQWFSINTPTMKSINKTTTNMISVTELENQALQQYRNSDESMEEKFNLLEKEAQEQYQM